MSAFEEIPTQPDQVEGWAIQYIIVGTVVTILACAFVVWLFLAPGTLEDGGRTDIVEQPHTIPPSSPFDAPTPVELERQAQEIELGRWQWAGPAHRRVVLPVDIAIDRYLQQKGAR